MAEIPARKLCLELLKEGNFALWTDAHGNGQPFLANPKNAVFYPFTWLYFILPFLTAFKLHYIIHVILGWIGLYCLCKSYSLSMKAAFLGTSLFFFSGMYLSSFEFYNHIAALAWMPWVLLVLDRTSQWRSLKFILLSSFWALLILAGAPEFILMTLIFAAAQAFIFKERRSRKIILAAAALSLACLISAVQLLPSFEMLNRTQRSDQAVDWPLDLIQLVNMPFPHFLGNDREPGHSDFWGWHLFDRRFPLYYSFYTGVVAVLLFFFGLKKPWDRRQKFLVALFSIFFLLACGRYSPFFFLYRITPFLASVRYPVKFFLGSVFVLSILAAIGFDNISGQKLPKKRTVTGLTALSVVSLLFFLLFRTRVLALLNKLFIIDRESSLRELSRSIGTGLVFFAACTAIMFLLIPAKNRLRFLGWVLIAFAVLDPAYHNRIVNPTVPESFFDKPPILNDLKPPFVIYRGLDYILDIGKEFGDNAQFFNYYRRSLYPFTGMGDRIRYVFNIDFYGTYPARFLRLMEAVKKLPLESQLKILRYLGCGYHIADQPLFSKDEAHRYTIENRPVFVERISAGAATPRIIFHAVQAAGFEEELRIFASDSFDPLKEAVTEKTLHLAAGPGEGEVPRIEVIKEVQGWGWYSVILPRQALAVFPGNFAPGWKAWIDGRKAEVFEVNLFSKGVLLPPGDHEIVLRYLPGSFLWGSALSLISLCLVLIIGFCIWAPIKKRGHPALP